MIWIGWILKVRPGKSLVIIKGMYIQLRSEAEEHTARIGLYQINSLVGYFVQRGEDIGISPITGSLVQCVHRRRERVQFDITGIIITQIVINPFTVSLTDNRNINFIIGELRIIHQLHWNCTSP